MHAIRVYPLQNRLLVIEYSDSDFAATLHSNGGSLHLRCCSKPLSQLPGRFQLSQKYVLWGGFWAWVIKRIARSQVRAVWWARGVVILFWAEKSQTSDKFFGTSFEQIFLMWRSSVMIRWTSFFGSRTSSAVKHTFKRRSLSRTAFTRTTLFSVLEVKDALRAVLPQRSTFRLWKPYDTWRLGMKKKQHPHKLSSTTATFQNQIFRVSLRT